MKSVTTLLLFLAGAFALVVAMIELPAYTKYTGEIFILLFMGGLFFALANTIRQTQSSSKGEARAETPEAKASS